MPTLSIKWSDASVPASHSVFRQMEKRPERALEHPRVSIARMRLQHNVTGLRFHCKREGFMPGITSGRKILIVDDERTIADTLALIFATNGYEARTAYSAEQALEMLDEWRPDLAVIDVVLPGMNGIEFAIFLT